MAVSTPAKMKYRYLGNSGLLVSQLSYGTYVSFETQVGIDSAYEMMEHAYKAGINFFDNAEAYADGKAEIMMGKCVQQGIERGVWQREDLVLSTKIFFSSKCFAGTWGPNGIGLSRKHIVEGTKASLKRMGQDYVDVIFCHRADPFTPMEEVVRAMNYVIEQGWALYWGTSEWNSNSVIEACDIADRLGLIRPVADQPQYNMLERSRVEFDFENLYKKYNYGLTTFSPLHTGVLTGKYTKDIPAGTRLSIPAFRAMHGDLLAGKVHKAAQLEAVAKEVGCTLAQLAVAWCATNDKISTVILGASSVKQLDENLKSLEFVAKITPEIRAKIDEIVQFTPKPMPIAPPLVYAQRTKFL